MMIVIYVDYFTVNSHLEGRRTGTSSRLLRIFTVAAMQRGIAGIDRDVTHYLALMTAASVFGRNRIYQSYGSADIYKTPPDFENIAYDLLIDLNGLNTSGWDLSRPLL